MQDGIVELFNQVADLSPTGRDRYFAERQIDDELRKVADELLAFDCPDSGPLARVVGTVAGEALSQLDGEGRRCGPYRLLNVIGRGGMGVVYLAERVDGEVMQRAAVKLLQPGFRTTQVDRFLQERQILAGLSHPNIARLLDAGHLDDGQPFLAMEYVEGKPIDVFGAGFGVQQQVRLFLKVCSAVAYLHRNLIVHRDLKPGNIFVSEDGEPRLLDFGIAKILDLTADATLTNMRMLTPAYASPEQVVGTSVSTTSDIYSLGAVLYHLLTGKSPHAVDDGSVAPLAEREIVRPSSWVPALKGDLDFILMKALRRDPQERYATVEQFADDLEAFLESRPIRARRGDAWYRIRKFLYRHWLPAAAVALAIGGLSAGLWVANRERAVAQQKSGQVRKLAGHLIFDLHDEIKKVPGATQAREKLVAVATDYLNGLAQEAGSDAELAWELMNAYYRLSETRGGVGTNLGRTEEAYDLSQKVMKMADNLQVSGHLDSQRIGTLFKIYDNLSRMYMDMRRQAAAADAVQRLLVVAPQLSPVQRAEAFSAASGYEEVFGLPQRARQHAEAAARILESHPDQQAILYERASNLMQLARVQAKLGLFEKAAQTYSSSIAVAEAAVRASPRDPRVRRHLYLAHVWAADLLGSDDRFNLGRVNEAERHFRAAITLAEEMAVADAKNEAARIDLARATGKMGSAIYRWRPAEALGLMNRAYALMRDTSAANHAAAEMKCAYFTESVKPLVRLGRIAQAQSNVDAAATLLNDLRARNPKREWTERQLSIYIAQSLIQEARGNWRAALAIAHRELDLIERGGEPSVLGEDYGRIGTLERIYHLGMHTDRPAAQRARKRLAEIWTKWQSMLPDSKYVADRLRDVTSARSGPTVARRPSQVPRNV